MAAWFVQYRYAYWTLSVVSLVLGSYFGRCYSLSFCGRIGLGRRLSSTPKKHSKHIKHFTFYLLVHFFPTITWYRFLSYRTAIISVGLYGFTLARDSVVSNRKSLMDIRKRIREQSRIEQEAELESKAAEKEKQKIVT